MDRRDLRTAALLTVLCVGGAKAVLPLALALGAAARPPMPAPLLVLLVAAQALVLFGIASFAGVALAGRLGLQPQVLGRLASGEAPPPGTGRRLLTAAGMGAVMGAVLFALDAWVFRGAGGETGRMVGEIALWKRLLAGVFYGGINEEVLLRLFLVSLVAWLLARAWRRQGGRRGRR